MKKVEKLRLMQESNRRNEARIAEYINAQQKRKLPVPRLAQRRKAAV